MEKDWTGNSHSLYKTLGASNHTSKVREVRDYYATEPRAAELLLDVETFDKNVWECACGEKHLSHVFEDAGYSVRSSDVIDRCCNEVYDFLSVENTSWSGDIVTNPPYKYAREFVEKALSVVSTGHKVAMFLKVLFLEGKARKKLFETFPPRRVYVSSSRLLCAKNGDFKTMRVNGGSCVAYAWYVWQKGYTGETTIKWIN